MEALEPKMNNSSKQSLSSLEKERLIYKIDNIARDVIRGKYGNGQERRIRLGSLYAPVQAKVNEMLRRR